MVSLPFKNDPPSLGDSRKQALSRFFHNERSLKSKGKLTAFNEALQEYLTLGHAHVIPFHELHPSHDVYYMPVHSVFKDTSTTTKVRPVFDASAKTSTGVSLNDCLLVGPNLYPPLHQILVKLRLHAIAMSADIGKMFREICLSPQQQDLHRFLLRVNDQVLDCRMGRVTFGVASSPFLATQTLRFLAQHFEDSHPRAAAALRTVFYVDDFVSGADSLEDASRLRFELCNLLAKAGMVLRKWRSNSVDFLDQVPPDLREDNGTAPLLSESHKALGIHWDTRNDHLYIAVPSLSTPKTLSKRHVASISAGVFDILGFFAPFTITARIILQETWRRQLKWDKPLPDDLQITWSAWTQELSTLKNHPIPRRYFTGPTAFLSLHGFSDASTLAYGAVVYLRAVQVDGSIHTALVTAKARVLPVRHITIPKAELLGAHLLAKLLATTATSLNVELNNVFAWSDSMIVLHWLTKSPDQLNDRFVANRVQSIADHLPHTRWHHVPTDQNPADLASRGVTVSDLIASQLWWSGPRWLSGPPDAWPVSAISRPQEATHVLSITPSHAMDTSQSHFLNELWSKFSSFHLLARVVSWIRRFVHNSRQNSSKINDSSLSFKEINDSTRQLIGLSQQQSFSEVFLAIKLNKSIPKNHSLHKLVVTQVDGLLIAQSRIRDPKKVSQPLRLLPLHPKSPFTSLVCSTLHVFHHHPGVSALHSIVCSTYVISGLRNLLKKISRSCATCQRAYAQPLSHQMGLLPPTRTSPSPPFNITGVDFAGPFYVRQGHVRRPVPVKAYAAVFVCLSTKAVHLELCSSLSSVDFRATLQRFISRRGSPSHIYCDNGSNFVGAREETRELRELLKSNKSSTTTFCQKHGIQWHHIPPRAPHFGGLWEAAVRQMKLLLKKNLSPHLLRYDELETLLLEAEAVLNSRPLAPINEDDEHSGHILTAGHFLIGRPLLATPLLEAPQAKTTSLRRWRLAAKLQQELWQQWLSHYLHTLHQRSKWIKQGNPLKVGDLVYLKDDTIKTTSRSWPMARVTHIFAGDDGQVRAARIKCGNKEYTRATNMLIPFLPEDTPTSTGNKQ